ncbi:hypothetical protein Cs7R123_05960 [Catellatospora sp. TT07R-123]|nr:hypothetical protein Cs7R123_05960 [Catellatospora sp. TT07R-123]
MVKPSGSGVDSPVHCCGGRVVKQTAWAAPDAGDGDEGGRGVAVQAAVSMTTRAVAADRTITGPSLPLSQ